jgi:hypothetical protein
VVAVRLCRLVGDPDAIPLGEFPADVASVTKHAVRAVKRERVRDPQIIDLRPIEQQEFAAAVDDRVVVDLDEAGVVPDLEGIADLFGKGKSGQDEREDEIERDRVNEDYAVQQKCECTRACIVKGS